MSSESLIILSTDTSQVTAILGDDKRLWEIETLFKALKNQGFDFEATHLTELDRIEKLLALLAIAFCWAHLLGEWLHEKKPIPIKSHHRPAISIFRYGIEKRELSSSGHRDARRGAKTQFSLRAHFPSTDGLEKWLG